MDERRRNTIGYVIMAAVLAGLLAGAFILSRTLPEPEGFAVVSNWRKAWMMGDFSPEAQNLESWTDLAPAIEKSLEYIKAKPGGETAFVSEKVSLTWSQIERSLMELKLVLPHLDDKPSLIAERFEWLELGRDVLATGYYTPLLKASEVRTEEYRYPLYTVPEDLKTLDLGEFHPRWEGQRLTYRMRDGTPVPYYDRGEIDFEDALEGRDLEVAWAGDLVEIFFLHIQGSGMLEYEDGTRRYVLYAGKNGRAYSSLGREMIRRGLLKREGVSMQSIRKYLRDNPEQARELLSTNPSYVFFKLGDTGPFGAMGRLLTPRVSVATDPSLFPLGSLLLLRMELPPEEPGGNPAKMNGLVLAQDTGGAIKGARLDLFCGMGREAEYMAGHMKNKARVALLISKNVL